MTQLKYTLLTDGSSDKTLLNIIKWLLDDLYPQLSCDGSFADFRHIPNPPQIGDVVQRVINFNVHYAVHLVAENIKDYSPLRELSAFREFEKDLKIAVRNCVSISQNI